MLFILLYREFGNVFSLTGSKTLQETLIRFVVFLLSDLDVLTVEYFPLSNAMAQRLFCWRKHMFLKTLQRALFSRTKNNDSDRPLNRTTR